MLSSYFKPFGSWKIGDDIRIFFEKLIIETPDGYFKFTNRTGMLIFSLIIIHYMRVDSPILSREELDLLLWDDDRCDSPDVRRNTAIKEARKEINDQTKKEIIRNKYGSGYFIFDDPVLLDTYGQALSCEETGNQLQEKLDIELIRGLLEIENPDR